MLKTSRLPKHEDCNCPKAVHRHGSRTTYVVHKCRCAPCREDNRLQAAQRRRAKLYGRYNRFVDGDQVRAHLRALMAQGMGWKRIAAAAGVGASTVYPILYGKYPNNPAHPEHRPARQKVRRDVAEKLLAVELDLAGGALVDATGARRRVQALVARGWSLNRIADQLGVLRSNLTVHKPDTLLIEEATRQAVAELYERWWDQEPPAVNRYEAAGVARAKRHAEQLGWAPPLAWDEDSIDNPDAVPDMGAPSGSRGAHRDDVVLALELHDTLEDAADWLGMSSSESLRVRLRRDGIAVPARMEVAAAEAGLARWGLGRAAS